MKLSGIDFPKKLLNALSDGSLVIFAGAGVSMGEPANLPNFRNLAKKIASGTGKKLSEGKPEDRFLGELKQSGVDIYKCASEVLNRPGLKPTELHCNLLRLFLTPESVRIVTTNFDLLFEHAAEKVFDSGPEVFRAPALPLGGKFSGIVHVHGSVYSPEDMILTDEDFGRAYLVEGWARRFLVELFRSFTVLFVGYSHNDTIMNYLARALSGHGKPRFALDTDARGKWEILGIEPVIYPSPDGSHSALYEGIDRLAKHFKRGVLDWRRMINELVSNPPSLLNEEERDTIDQALADVSKMRFFTEAASSPEWIEWLDWNKYLDGLFYNGTLSERDTQLAHWLTVKFSCNHANRLFRLIGGHGMRLNPDFWHGLARFVGLDKENSWDKETLSRWISLLLATAPPYPQAIMLLWLGERCIKHEMFDSMIEVFDTMAASRLRLFAGPDIDDEDSSITADLKPSSDHHAISSLWENYLKPNRDRVAESLIANVIGHLERQHFTLSTWGSADRKWNPASMNRSAIEPNEQDKHPKAFDVLIDATRDCMEWLALNRMETAAQLCGKLAVSEAPLLRRLAVHTSVIRKDLGADEKIDWLLSNFDLRDISIHHELFRAVIKTYPDSGPERRQNVINAVLAYRWPDQENEKEELYAAGVHIDWFNSLHTEKPDCAFAKQALDEVRERFPNLRPSEHPEHLVWTGDAEFVGSQSPWTVEELLSESAEKWSEKLLSFKQEKLLESYRQGLVLAVGEAAKKDFKWGLSLAHILVNRDEWDTDIWPALLKAWSETGITEENQFQEVTKLLSRTELYDKNILSVSRVLCALVKDDSRSCPPSLLSQANRIAETLWGKLDREKVLSDEFDWPTRAINHPAGDLTQFWLRSLNSWRNRQDPIPEFLGDEYRSVLSVIIQDGSISGRLGRCVLAGHFHFLLRVDEKWTKENLLPLFEECLNEEDYNAAWAGFVQWQQLAPDIAELLEQPFLEAVRWIKKDYPNRHQRSRFISVYTTMMVYFAKDPIGTWIPGFFKNADEKDKLDLASAIRWHLAHMDEERQKELWDRWLKPYWENRLKGIPPSLLEPREINLMLTWLPHLNKLFPEAVDLAIQMPPGLLERNYIVHEVTDSDLPQSYPEAVAKLLIYLGTCDLPNYEWYKGKELIDKLLQSDIDQEFKGKLKELIIQLRLR